MNFVAVKGSWKNAKKLIPDNNEEKYYAVTMGMTNKYYRMVAEEYWRFYNNRWEMLFEGKWKPLTNNLWEVIAYMEVVTLEPCELN